MRHLRIALGFRTGHRSTEAAVLAIGTDQATLQAAVNAAGPEFQRFEFGVFQYTRKAARARSSHITPALAGGGETADTPPPASNSDPSPSAPAEPTAESDGADTDLSPADDGPTIESPDSRSRRRK